MDWSCRNECKLRAYVEGGGVLKKERACAAATYIATSARQLPTPPIYGSLLIHAIRHVPAASTDMPPSAASIGTDKNRLGHAECCGDTYWTA